MPSVTEIYVCKPGQKLKKGKLFTSNDIHDRQAAELGARERCRFDDSIAKIAYYAIQDDGGYKSILIYENPGVDLSTVPTNGRESLISAAAEANVHTQTSEKPRYSLFSKVVTFFTEEAN